MLCVECYNFSYSVVVPFENADAADQVVATTGPSIAVCVDYADLSVFQYRCSNNERARVGSGVHVTMSLHGRHCKRSKCPARCAEARVCVFVLMMPIRKHSPPVLHQAFYCPLSVSPINHKLVATCCVKCT